MIETLLFVEPQRQPEGGEMLYRVAPLLFPEPSTQDHNLWKATSRLSEELARMLRQQSQAGDHRGTAQYAFLPRVTLHNLELRLELKGGLFRGWFPVAIFRHLDRTLAFSPKLRDCWFELEKGDSLEERATEVYRHYFRALEKTTRSAGLPEGLRPFGERTKPWITTIELHVQTVQKLDERPPDFSPFWAEAA